MKIYQVCLLFFLSICSCGVRHQDYTMNKPVNIDSKEGKWLIDEPLLEKVDFEFENITAEYYKTFLCKNFDNFKYINELSKISSLKKSIEKNLKTLEIYKEQTNFDYLISTKIQLYHYNNSLKTLSIRIFVYDLNTKNLIFDNYYRSYEKIENTNSKGLKKFINASVKDAVLNFSKKENWNYVYK
jgi:hypothetical protein